MKVNVWGEPARGPDVPERGDRVQHVRGTTTGYMIGVTTCQGSTNCNIGHQERSVHRVSIVPDGPCSPGKGGKRPQHTSEVMCFLEIFGARELRIVKKGVPG